MPAFRALIIGGRVRLLRDEVIFNSYTSMKLKTKYSTSRIPVRIVQTGSGRLVFVGADSTQGTYVLRIRVDRPLNMAFGRFKRGKIIDVDPGDYVYVGSALGKKGPSCPARRLVRHATRLGTHPPHSIRKLMCVQFPRIGLAAGDLLPRNGKNPRWNVDHLLDKSCAELTGAYLIRSPMRIEGALGKLVELDPATIVFERGLGANDITGNTHLLRVDAGEDWWQELPNKLVAFIRAIGG